MRQKRNPRMAVLALALGVAFGAARLSAAESDGRAVFEAQKCNLCHAVSTAGIEANTRSDKLKGPDLVNVAENFEARALVKLLKKGTDKGGESHSKPFKGSDEELQALVDWLLEQKAEG